VVQLIARARRVYRPESFADTTFDLNYLLHEVVALAQKYLSQRKVKLETQLMGEWLSVTAVFSELALAFLCPMLELADQIGIQGGGEMTLRAAVSEPHAQVMLITPSVSLPPDGFDLPLCHRVMTDYHGTIEQYQKEQQTIIEMNLPLSAG
jgi:hypothetical protein